MCSSSLFNVGYQDKEALRVYRVKQYETNQRICVMRSSSQSIYPRREMALKRETHVRNIFQGRPEHSSHFKVVKSNFCEIPRHLKPERWFSGKCKCFLYSDSSHGSWSKSRNLAKLRIPFTGDWQDSQNCDQYSLRFKARADFEPDIGADGPDSVPSFKVLPESVPVERLVDQESVWWKRFPKRWVIVLLCFFAFLLCNMDRVCFLSCSYFLFKNLVDAFAFQLFVSYEMFGYYFRFFFSFQYSTPI